MARRLNRIARAIAAALAAAGLASSTPPASYTATVQHLP